MREATLARCGGRLVRCHWHHAGRMAWTMVAVAGLLEIVWAVLLKQSEGFSKLWPSVGFFAAGTGSIVLLALALRTLPVGSAYAAWTGIGAVGTAIAGIVLLDETARPGKVASIALVVVGIVGLRLFSEH
jgi:quaternary ammonium compound-resistance protein SugE